MEVIVDKKRSIIISVIILLVTMMLFMVAMKAQANEDNLGVAEKVNGIWKFDGAKTLKLRIEKGVPFHIGDKYGMGGGGRVIRQFDNGTFKFYDEKKCKVVDKGKFEIIESNKNEVVLRIFPEDDFRHANNYKFEELIRFTQLSGFNIPFIIGFRFIDDNTVQSFSYVRGFENNMVKKDDNAYWKRIYELPKKPRDQGGTRGTPLTKGGARGTPLTN